jgi:DNA-binding PadR family transcriptional regulator
VEKREPGGPGRVRANATDRPSLKRIEFLVLAVLEQGPLHGYGVTKEIERLTRGAVQVRPGSLYRVLDRLMHRGLLAPSEGAETDEPGHERRSYYRITERGRTAVRAEADFLTSIAAPLLASAGPSGSTP